jgi:hypothetical protein
MPKNDENKNCSYLNLPQLFMYIFIYHRNGAF